MSIKYNPFTGSLEVKDNKTLKRDDIGTTVQPYNANTLIGYTQTPIKTADYTARDLDSIPCDTTYETFTVTLPNTGKVNIFDAVGIDNKSGFTIYPLIVEAPPSTTIMGADTYKLFVGGTNATFELINGDWRLTDISYPNQPRNADNVYWVDPNGDDNNSGRLSSDPVRTIRRALELIEDYAAANGINGNSNDCIKLRAGVYIEDAPLVVRRGVAIMADSLRVTEVRPTESTKTNNLFLVDSGVKFWGITFAGHQAGSFAIAFNPNADNRAIGASGLGAYILKSPYIQNCTSYTAQDDEGLAGSISQGSTGGGLEVDGAKCASNSPIRSMVVDSFTQVNLNGPGCLVKNDGYAQLVSFFATFCTYHVRTETGGQVNLSGGGTTDFGTYGLMANGYSPAPLFIGQARQDEKSSSYKQNSVTINVTDNNVAVVSDLPHELKDGDLIKFNPTGTLELDEVGLETNRTYYVINADDVSTPKTFQVSEQEGGIPVTLVNPTDADLTKETFEYRTQGVTEIDIINFTSSRLGTISGSISRPTAGQLMFPQLVFPRDEQTKNPISKIFDYTRTADNKLIYTEEPSTIVHEYVDGGTVIIGDIFYSVVNAVYNNENGEVEIEVDDTIDNETGTVTVQGLNFICPSSAYVVTGSTPIDASGSPSTENIAGYRVNFYSSTNRYLKDDVKAGQLIDFRNRSQISAPSHTFEFVGSGTNYAALPFNGGVPNPANKVVEENNGRVYSSNTDEQGNFAVGTQFTVDGTSGSVTINTDQFNLSGLNAIGPFSRSGIDSVGVQLKEVSNNENLISSTGAADGNTVPTQFAVKTYLENEYTPLTRIIDTSTGLIGGGDLSTNRSLALNQSSIDSLLLADSSLQPDNIGDNVQPASKTISTPPTNPINGQEWWDNETGDKYIYYEGGLSSQWVQVTILGNLITPNLGDIAYSDASDFATALQGLLADSALQPTDIGVTVQEYNADIVIDPTYVATENNYTTAEKDKLAGIAEGAEINVNADWNALSGDALILNKPTLGTAAFTDATDYATAAQGSLINSALQPGDNLGQLFNDVGYITLSDVLDNSGIQPGDNVSELFNDAGYITLADVPDGGGGGIQPGDNVSELFNDVGYITLADVPDGGAGGIQPGDNVSVLTNDVGYITLADVPDGGGGIQPGDNVSVLTNDAGYITLADVPDSGGIQAGDNVSVLTNDAGYITLAQVPDSGGVQPGDNVSILTNDAGYITLAQVPDSGGIQPGDNVSVLNNDAGYITLAQVPDSGGIQAGDNVSVLNNDAGYITLAEVTFTTLGVSSYAQTLLDDENASAALITLGAASLDSPSFTGTPTGPTAAVNTNSTQLATTAFVQTQIATPFTRSAVAVSDSIIDCDLGNYYTKTVSSNTTFSFSDAPSTGTAYGFTLEVTHFGGTITWPSSVKWPEDIAPTLTTGKTHLFVFITDNGGTRWRGAALADYTN